MLAFTVCEAQNEWIYVVLVIWFIIVADHFNRNLVYVCGDNC